MIAGRPRSIAVAVLIRKPLLLRYRRQILAIRFPPEPEGPDFRELLAALQLFVQKCVQDVRNL